MKKKLYLAAAFCMIIATGCTNNKKSANSDNVVANTMQVADMHNAETSLDYFGEYKGTIPAADCPGIEVTLIFNKDRTYTQKYIYLERKDGEFNETGTFKVEGNILPTLAEESARESLIPSPIIITLCPSSFSFSTKDALSSGRTSE